MKNNKSLLLILGTSGLMVAVLVSMIALGFNKSSYAFSRVYEEEILLNGTLSGVEAKNGTKTVLVERYSSKDNDDNDNARYITRPIYTMAYGQDLEDNSKYNDTSEEITDKGILYLLGHSGTVTNHNLRVGTQDWEWPDGESGYAVMNFPEHIYSYDRCFVGKNTLNFELPDDFDVAEYDPNTGEPAVFYTGEYLASMKTVYIGSRFYALENYATQVAIWIYNYEQTGKGLTAEDYNFFKGNVDLYYNDELLYSGNFYNTYLKTIIDEAKAESKKNYDFNIVLNSKSISKQDNNYVTDEFEVTTNDGKIDRYSVTLSGIDDAYVINDKGEKIEDEYWFSGSKKFRVVIPAGVVTEKAKKLNIFVDGVFDAYLVSAKVYKNSDNSKSIIGLSELSYAQERYTNMDIMTAPNTASATNPLIYVLGVAVMVIGASVITVNVVQKNEQ